MSRRKPLVCAVIAASAFTPIAAAPASGATAPRQATLTAVGGVEFVPNRGFRLRTGLRYHARAVVTRADGGGVLGTSARVKLPRRPASLSRRPASQRH